MSTPDAEGSEMVQANADAVALSEKVIARSEWLPIGTAPKDQSIIVAASNTYQKTLTVGEARWQQDDPDHPDDGDWWWANISPGDYTGDSISNMNGPVEYWQPLPSPPGAELTISNDAERDAVSLNQSSSASLSERLSKHIERLANTRMELPLSEWSDISGDFLQSKDKIASLTSTVEKLREALTKLADVVDTERRTHEDYRLLFDLEGPIPSFDAAYAATNEAVMQARAALSSIPAPSTDATENGKT